MHSGDNLDDLWAEILEHEGMLGGIKATLAQKQRFMRMRKFASDPKAAARLRWGIRIFRGHRRREIALLMKAVGRMNKAINRMAAMSRAVPEKLAQLREAVREHSRRRSARSRRKRAAA